LETGGGTTLARVSGERDRVGGSGGFLGGGDRPRFVGPRPGTRLAQTPSLISIGSDPVRFGQRWEMTTGPHLSAASGGSGLRKQAGPDWATGNAGLLWAVGKCWADELRAARRSTRASNEL
jgi:hypothetical protein